MAVPAVGRPHPCFGAHFKCVTSGGVLGPVPLRAGAEAGGSAAERPWRVEPGGTPAVETTSGWIGAICFPCCLTPAPGLGPHS